MSVSLHLSFTEQLRQSAGLDPREQLVKEGKEIMGECKGQAKRLVSTSDSFSCSCIQLLTHHIQFICLFLCVSQFLVCLKVSFFFKFECTCHFPALTAASPHLLFSPTQCWDDCPTGRRELSLSPSLAQPFAFLLPFQTSDSDEFTECMRWELNYTAGSSQAPASQHSSTAHTDQVSAGILLKEAVLVYVPKLSKPRIPW